VDVQLLREMVDAGKLGDIYYAKTASIRRRGTPIGWFTDMSKAGGGPVIDIGVHCIDRAWFLMGCPKPTRVSAAVSHAIGNFETKGVSRWTALDSDVTAFDTEDSAAGVVHFENGACLLFEVSWALNTKPQDYTQICGSKAGATLDPLTIYGEDMGYLTDNQPTFIPQGMFDVEIDHFLHCVRTGDTPTSPLAHAVTMQRILQGIYDSAAQGKEVIL
ncbi:MAG: Gfo/Idh/MocA family oxidoreductase, partial [Clostridia bacterium]